MQVKRDGGVTWKGAVVRMRSFKALGFLYLFLENVLKIWKGFKEVQYGIEV